MPPIHVGEWSGQEKRKHKRVPLHVPIECRAGQTTLEARAENVSSSGLLIRTEAPFPEGEELTLCFSLPDSPPVIQCRAHVAHVVPGAFMGVEFLDLSSESLDRIEKYVAAAPALQGKRM